MKVNCCDATQPAHSTKTSLISCKNCSVGTLLVSAVGGAIIATLAALQIFGGVNSVGFIAGSVAGGSAVVVSSGIILIITVVSCVKKERSVESVDEIAEEAEEDAAEIALTLDEFKERLASGRQVTKEQISNLNLFENASNGSSAVCIAAEYGNVEMMKTLIERCKNSRYGFSSLIGPDSQANTPLHIAIEKGNIEVAKLLINEGALSGTLNGEGLTVFHLAAKHLHEGIMKLICDRRNQICEESSKHAILDMVPVKTRNGDTALHLAVDNDDNPEKTCRVIDELLECGVEIDATDGEGQTALSRVQNLHNNDAIIKHLHNKLAEATRKMVEELGT